MVRRNSVKLKRSELEADLETKSFADVVKACRDGEYIDVAFHTINPIGEDYYACPFAEIYENRCPNCEEIEYIGHFGVKDTIYKCNRRNNGKK